ncbi:MAG: phosphatase PAP2 family protein [Gemmatimonadaceae bacterium]
MSSIKTLCLSVVVLAMADAHVSPLLAQADSIKRQPFFTWRDVAILEAFAIATVAIAPLDTRLAQRLQDATVQENRAMRRTATFVETVTDPGAVIIGAGLYAFGRIAKKHKAADLGLHGTEALLIGSQLGSLLKGIVGRARPYVNVDDPHNYRSFRGFRGGSDFRSFPSGHAIAAFAAASAVTSETKRWWPKSVFVIGPMMYGGAAAVGWSRMYDNKHWASDVITGAAIGTFAGLKVVTWHHMHPGNTIDRIFLGATVGPSPDGGALLRLHFRPVIPRARDLQSSVLLPRRFRSSE